MGLFRKKKYKRIHTAALATSQVFKDDRLKETIIKNILKKVRYNMSGQEYVMEFAKDGANMFRSYKYRGEDMDNITTIRAITTEIPTENIKNVIKEAENTNNIEFHDLDYRDPENDEWVIYQLQKLYNYSYEFALCIHNNMYYKIEELEPGYDFENEPEEEEEEEEENPNPEIEIEEIEGEEDEYEIGQIPPVYYNYDEERDMFIVNLKASSGRIKEVQKLQTITYNDNPDYLIEPEINPEVMTPEEIETILANYYNQEVNIIEDIIVFEQNLIEQIEENEEGELEEKEVVINSNIVETIKIEKIITVKEFLEIEENPFLETTERINYPFENDTITIEIPIYDETKEYFIVYYNLLDYGNAKVWIYNPSLDIYPELSNYTSKIRDYDAFPVTTIRTQGYGVDEYNGPSSKKLRPGNRDITVYKRSILTEKFYHDTDYIVKSFGLPVDDILKAINKNPDIAALYEAHIVIGVKPKSTNPMVSKALFYMFKQIYEDLNFDFVKENTISKLQIREDKYNATLSFIPQPISYTKEKLSIKEGYKHSIKQVVETVEVSKGKYKYVVVKEDNPISKNPTEILIVEGPNSKRGVIPIYYSFISPGKAYILWQVEVIKGFSLPAIYYVRFDKEKNILELYYTKTFNSEYLILQKQISSNTVENIKIRVNLDTSDPIFRLFMFIFPQKIKGKYPIWHSTIAAGGHTFAQNLQLSDSNLVIPIPLDVLKNFNLMEQVELLGVSVHLMFHTYRYDKIKYYKSTVFGDILGIAIAIAVNVILPGGGIAIGAMTLVQTAAIYIVSITVQAAVASFTSDPRIISLVTTMATLAMNAYLGNIDFSSLEFDLHLASDLVELSVQVVDLFLGGRDVNTQLKNLEEKTNKMWEIYQRRSDELDEKLEKLQSGLGPEFFAELNYGIVEYDSRPTPPYLYSPDFIRYVMLEMYKDIDLLYRNPIETLIQNKLQVGILDI